VPPRTQLSRDCCHLWTLLPVNRLALLSRIKSPSGLIPVASKIPPFCQLFDKTQCCIWHSGFPGGDCRVSVPSPQSYLFISGSFPRNIGAFRPRINYFVRNRALCTGIDIATVSPVKAIRPFIDQLEQYIRGGKHSRWKSVLFTERSSPVA
jgi:hypothetical protein